MAVAERQCQWEVARENYQSVLCQQPAIVVIDRRDKGHLAICKKHMNDPLLYREVQANGYTWTVIGSDQTMGGTNAL